ncbi:membrane-spanning 4-domains subfamily A member 3 isoform X2 [Bubalus bubalis]|uniref:membrane-spanning 4-domains subfamily A member 3 isoform X2 n=1 Tax=Bubalus bubalis TaxID=89462 RepID=UPI001E1B9548|nr:membrane-spanning 4-domains subfamily A member 3 isoform X2 [Bubalus bubalis]
MEVSVTLEISILLDAWIWPCTENIRVKVSCSMDWVMVSVSPCVYRNRYIFADELYLGSGCPVTRIQTYVYDFIYPVYECVIRIKPSRPQMASQEADPTELPAACAGEAPGSLGQAAAADSSAYRPGGRSQSHPEVLQALGVVQILNGAVILALGGLMHSLQNLSYPSNYLLFSVVYTGYSTWGAIFFIVSGILSVLAGKKRTKTLLESSLGMHSASATVALVGIVFLSMNLFANEPLLKDCQSSRPPDLCIYMAASSNAISSLSNPGESRMPPKESKEIQS